MSESASDSDSDAFLLDAATVLAFDAVQYPSATLGTTVAATPATPATPPPPPAPAPAPAATAQAPLIPAAAPAHGGAGAGAGAAPANYYVDEDTDTNMYIADDEQGESDAEYIVPQQRDALPFFGDEDDDDGRDFIGDVHPGGAQPGPIGGCASAQDLVQGKYTAPDYFDEIMEAGGNMQEVRAACAPPPAHEHDVVLVWATRLVLEHARLAFVFCILPLLHRLGAALAAVVAALLAPRAAPPAAAAADAMPDVELGASTSGVDSDCDCDSDTSMQDCC